MKDGRTHLAYKAEHTIDLESEFLLDAIVYHGDEADTATLTESLSSAQENLEQAEVYRDIEEAVADKGYHANQTLADCREWGSFGLRTYIPEPDSRHERRWSDKPPEYKAAVYANRRLTPTDVACKQTAANDCKRNAASWSNGASPTCVKQAEPDAVGCVVWRRSTSGTKWWLRPATWAL